MSGGKNWTAIETAIAKTTGTQFLIEKRIAVSGGCINTTIKLQGRLVDYFVKLNRAELLEMFSCEALGLEEIIASGTVKAPRPICHGVAGDQSYLVLECLSLRSCNPLTDRLFGQQLAEMHRRRYDAFGWIQDNFIGSSRQPNKKNNEWANFWKTERLGFQLDLASKRGYGGHLQSAGERLRESLDKLFAGYSPNASLLHGDLWAGNYAEDASGEPVIFDPACYYGDREADLAMTELFGGFGSGFYDEYYHAYPIDPGYSVRKILYNLYHVLNHLNLFGGGYRAQAESMIDRLLAEIG